MERQVQNIIFRRERILGKYHHIFLIDRSRKIVISPNHGEISAGSPSSHVGQDASENQWAMYALDTGLTQVSDYSSWVESDHTHQMLFYPVRDVEVLRAVLGFEKQIPYVREISEGFSTRRNGQDIPDDPRWRGNRLSGYRKPGTKNHGGFPGALQTGFFIERRINAQGVEVIDLYLKNEKYPWVLVAEIETQEAFMDLYESVKN